MLHSELMNIISYNGQPGIDFNYHDEYFFYDLGGLAKRERWDKVKRYFMIMRPSKPSEGVLIYSYMIEIEHNEETIKILTLKKEDNMNTDYKETHPNLDVFNSQEFAIKLEENEYEVPEEYNGFTLHEVFSGRTEGSGDWDEWQTVFSVNESETELYSFSGYYSSENGVDYWSVEVVPVSKHVIEKVVYS